VLTTELPQARPFVAGETWVICPLFRPPVATCTGPSRAASLRLPEHGHPVHVEDRLIRLVGPARSRRRIDRRRGGDEPLVFRNDPPNAAWKKLSAIAYFGVPLVEVAVDR
jgi:hypothetical protein